MFTGGYLDTDVQIVRKLEDSIKGEFVSAIENHRVGSKYWDRANNCIAQGYEDRFTSFCLQAGFMYSEKSHPFVIQCMKDIYDNGNREFLKSNGEHNGFVIDATLWNILHKDYGLKFLDKTQRLKNGILIYDSSVYATRKTKTKDSYLIHWFDQTWRADASIKMRVKTFIKQKFYWLYRLQ